MSVATDSVGAIGRGRLRGYVERHRSGPWGSDAVTLTVVAALLLLIGLVMSFSASVVDAAEGGDPFGILRRQIAWAVIGVPLYVLASALDLRIWRRLSGVMMLAAIAGLIAVLVPNVGLTRGGATRWIGFGPMVMQPSELAKLATLLFLAHLADRSRPPAGQPIDVRGLLKPALVLFGIEGLLIMREPDLGTAVLIGMIVALVLFVEGLPLRLFAAWGALGAVGVAAATRLAPYRMARITGWLHPELDPTGTGYQLLQSLYAMADGGLFGVGIGNSRGKWNWVPNPETDFVFSIIGEELGLIGAFIVIGLFVALLIVGLRVARQAQEPFARTIAFGITAWLVGQACINIATVIGLLPITGMTLPLVSAGGSSLVSTLVALGILVSIARSNAEAEA